MHLKSSDPDIQTICSRIMAGELDLQPEFQRGEVWTESKRQRLIDSILREWQVPPIHIVVDNESNIQSVLDGQQRLAAIRDFVANRLSVNGRTEPHDSEIAALHGLRYESLPNEVRRRFDRYSLRVFYIYDYSPEEPGELFYRLNQNSALSPAEQRNAFFGHARRQVKNIIEEIQSGLVAKTYFGFSNARMAYDDIVARALVILENGTLRQRASSGLLVDKYRSTDGFSDSAVMRLREGLGLLAEASPWVDSPIKLNKATALSWLVFSASVARILLISPSEFGKYVSFFEDARAKRSASYHDRWLATWSNQALDIFEDRATSRVGDVSSVVLRDLVLWMHLIWFIKPDKTFFRRADYEAKYMPLVEYISDGTKDVDLELLAEVTAWGTFL
ncbi:DUF262 domain-containing protein [Frateuria sp. GZRe14]|uniref:DUF262 domain-containing protein n=1 Tax=Frateuria sp. GZRe14 TaxID=3351534 RepID=UPI003EDC237F